MKVYVKCKDCGIQLFFKTWSPTRVDLKMELGESIMFICDGCGSRREYEVNDFRARGSKISTIISLMIFVICTPTLLYLFWDVLFRSGFYGIYSIAGIILLPLGTLIMIGRSDSNRVSNFNRS